MLDKDISASILQQVLQVGYLNYDKLMENLMRITKSKDAQFFEVLSGNAESKYVCKYSTTTEFIAGMIYTLNDLPFDQITIMHKSSPISMISLDNQSEFDIIPDDCRQRILDSICIGIVMGNLKDTKFTFTMSVCRELSRIVTEISDLFANLQIPDSQIMDKETANTIDTYLTDVIRILYETIDYMEIDSENVVLQNDPVDVNEFIDEIIGLFTVGNVTKIVDESVPKIVLMDKTRVQQILIAVLKKVTDLTDIHFKVSLFDISSSGSQDVFIAFRTSSPKTKESQEIQERFQIDHVTVSSLDLFICKRLCEIMSGTFEVDESGVMMKVKIDIPVRADAFKNKIILVGTKDVNLSANLEKIFTSLGSETKMFNNLTYTTLINQCDMVVLDAYYGVFSRLAKSKNIPVVALLTASEKSTMKNTTMFDTILSIPFSSEEVRSKCESLLLRRKSS